MQTKIQKWGNSLAVRIPKPFVKEARLAYGSSVDLSILDGKIVIAPHPEASLSLDDLLNGVTQKNIHKGIETGSAVGREVW